MVNDNDLRHRFVLLLQLHNYNFTNQEYLIALTHPAMIDTCLFLLNDPGSHISI